MKNIAVKKNEMPTVRIVKIFSWIFLFGGISVGICIGIFFPSLKGIGCGAIIITSALLIMLGLRMLCVISQTLFNTQGFLFKRLNEMQAVADTINQHCLKISCDAKDLNTNLYEIKDFFSKIAKRLDLNE